MNGQGNCGTYTPWNITQSLVHFNVFYFICNLFIFNWRIVALQYCIGFCHISTWISHRYISVFLSPELPTPSHFSRLGTETLFEPPEPYSKFPLAICFTYDNVHVPKLLFPFVPWSPSTPSIHKSLLHVFISITAFVTCWIPFLCSSKSILYPLNLISAPGCSAVLTAPVDSFVVCILNCV